MSASANFLIYAMEIYRQAKNLSGREVAALFERHGLFDYVYDYADSLHTTGNDYIVGDIDGYIARLNATGRARTESAPQRKGAAA